MGVTTNDNVPVAIGLRVYWYSKRQWRFYVGVVVDLGPVMRRTWIQDSPRMKGLGLWTSVRSENNTTYKVWSDDLCASHEKALAIAQSDLALRIGIAEQKLARLNDALRTLTTRFGTELVNDEVIDVNDSCLYEAALEAYEKLSTQGATDGDHTPTT